MSTVHIKTKSAPPRRVISIGTYLSNHYSEHNLPCAVQVVLSYDKDATVYKVVRHARCSYMLHNLTDPTKALKWASGVIVYEDSIVPLHLAEVLGPLDKRDEIDRKVGDILRGL